MEDQYQHTLNGQSVLKADLNTLGETAALADDRVLAELFRMTPFDGSTVRKGILPMFHETSGTTALVAPNGATGSVIVNPFRAFVGSRTAVATDAKKNWRDIRTAIGVGTTTLAQVVTFAANASGTGRWDLVYAAVAIDANTASVTRKKKDPTTKVIAGASVVTRLATTVALGAVAGTPAASPVFPAAPADAGGVYYVPLAYVFIPNGFSGASTIPGGPTIISQAPVLRLSPSSGGVSCGPADQQYVLTTTQQGIIMGGLVNAPKFMPPDMTGGQSLLVALDLQSASSANWSHQNNGLVDSRDWRNRISKWICQVNDTQIFEWTAIAITNFPGSLSPFATGASTNTFVGMGTTFVAGGFNANAFRLAGVSVDDMDDGATVTLYADGADGGKLKVAITGTPLVKIFIWIEFTGVFTNRL